MKTHILSYPLSTDVYELTPGYLKGKSLIVIRITTTSHHGIGWIYYRHWYKSWTIRGPK